MTAPITPKQQVEIDRWVKDPLYWATRFAGEDFDPSNDQKQMWQEYGKLLNAKLKRYEASKWPEVGIVLTEEEELYANKLGISVMAAQGQGKERSVVTMAHHFYYVLQGYQCRVVCTAPAGPTLYSTLWPEFARVQAGSPVLSQVFTRHRQKIFLKDDPTRGEDSWIKPRTIQRNSNPDEQAEVLAGIHATCMLYIATEATGIQDPVFRPIEGGLTDPIAMIFLIFNPTRLDGFAMDTHGKNRKHWICLQWSGRTLKQEKLANPGRLKWFNERAQDVLIEKFGEESDFVRVRVDGLPPRKGGDTLVHYDAMMAAMEREVEILPHDPLCIGVDVGGEGEGSDPSVITLLRGPKVISQKSYRLSLEGLSDLVAGLVRDARASMGDEVQIIVAVDYIGIGRAVYESLSRKHELRNVKKIDVAEVALSPAKFHRLRDQLFWELREAFMETRTIAFTSEADEYESGTKAIENRQHIIGQLTSIKWGSVILGNTSKIKVQGKGVSSGLPGVKPLPYSPDEADSLGLAWFAYQHYCSYGPARDRLRGRWGTPFRRMPSYKTI